MLRKFIARLRESIAPAKKPKPAAPQGASRPQEGPAPRRPAHAGEGRPQGQGQRQPQGRPQGHSHGGHPQGRPQEGRPRQDERRPAGRGPSRSGPGRPGDGRRPRPVRDDFEHPAPVTFKPAVPVDIPKMDTVFSKLGLIDALAYAVQEMGYIGADADPGPGDPAHPRGQRRDRLGADRDGQDRRIRAAHHPAPRPPRRHALPDPRAHPRARAPGRGGLPQVRAIHRPAGDDRLRRRRLRQADRRPEARDGHPRGDAGPAPRPPRAGQLLPRQDRHPRPGRGRPDARHGLPARREADRPEVRRRTARRSSSRRPFPRRSSSWPAGRCATRPRSRSAASTPPPTRSRTAFYPVVASQKFDLLQLLLERTEFKSVLIFCRTRMGADRIAARLVHKGHRVGRHAFRPEPARARRGARGLQERQERGAGRHRHRRARPRHRGRLPRDQLRRPGERRGLRPPDRPHRPRPATRGTRSRS